MICTSIEQSKDLMELGLDPNTADMFWDTLISKKPETHVWNHHFIDELIDDRVPAWSLSALLEIWGSVDTHVMLYKGVSNNLWHGKYQWFSSPIDAAFDIVCNLLVDGRLWK